LICVKAVPVAGRHRKNVVNPAREPESAGRAAMEQSYAIALATSLMAASVTTIGVLTVRRFEAWARASTTYFASFAAGVLVSVSFLHIIPTALNMNAAGPAWMLGGFVAMYGVNRFVTAYVCDKPGNEDFVIGLIPMIGIAFHSFVDGVIYAVAFNVDALTGVLTAIGLVLHEFPEGIVTYALLLRSGFRTSMALVLALAAAAATTPLGTLVSHPLIADIEPVSLGAMLAVTAGMLVYVGATHLLCHAQQEPRRYSAVAMGAGIVVAIGIIAAKG